MIRNLVFDFGGVVVDINMPKAIAAFDKLGVPNVSQWLNPYHQNGFFLEVEDGRTDAAGFCQTLSRVCGREVSMAEAREAWLCIVEEAQPDRLRFLSSLRDRYHLFLLSNTNPFVMDWARSSAFSADGLPLDAYFDKLFISYQLQSVKPSAAFFETLIREAPLRPEESLFVDDGPANIAAAQALGFHTYLVTNGVDWRPGVQAYLASFSSEAL